MRHQNAQFVTAYLMCVHLCVKCIPAHWFFFVSFPSYAFSVFGERPKWKNPIYAINSPGNIVRALHTDVFVEHYNAPRWYRDHETILRFTRTYLYTWIYGGKARNSYFPYLWILFGSLFIFFINVIGQDKLAIERS